MSEADSVDLVALTEKAELLAEATGRDITDVLADLLDDGELNFSSGTDAIIEKGILDKANEQAEKAKTLLITLMPVIAILLGGGGAEMLGITDFTGLAEGDVEDEPYIPTYEAIWGCTAWDADNYDSYATEDDGSCVWPIYGCTNPASSTYNPDATIDDGTCQPEHHDKQGCTDSDADNYDPEADEDDGSCYYAPEPIEGCTDPAADNYQTEADEDDGSCEYQDTSIEDCSVEILNRYRGLQANDTEGDAVLVSFKVHPIDCEGLDIDVGIELFQNGYAPNMSKQMTVMGDSDTDLSHLFDFIPAGNWTPKVRAGVQGESKVDVNLMSIEIEEYEPCNQSAFFFSVEVTWIANETSNKSELQFRWDADLRCPETMSIEVDMMILNITNHSHFFTTFKYNTTGDDLDWKSFMWTPTQENMTWSVHLSIWWESDAGWRKGDEYSQTIECPDSE